MDQRPYSPLTARKRSRQGEIEFRILGPLEVLDGDRFVELPGQRQRNLLAFLLLHANQVVSRDRLIDESAHALRGERSHEPVPAGVGE